MITYSNLGKPGHGRLGNQLFQIASTMGIADRNGVGAYFPNWRYATYFDNISYALRPGLPTHKEKIFEYYDINETDADLIGWFQSEKYFGSVKPQLKHVVKHDTPTIAISIRRGDYVGNPNYYEIPIHWYISALLSIPDWKQHRILFFSDDLEYCKVHFECLDNAEFCGGSDIQQLQRMAGCEKHIIANSTFSWWGAYLSGSNHVIHSGRLFAGRLAELHTGADFYPERWIKHEGEKLDLKDVTFTIPVFYDHKDRKENIDLSVCMLQKSFDTTVVIEEQVPWPQTHFDYFKKWCTYNIRFSKDFHRTSMLNDMCKEAKTPIVCNFDCDVILPPMQIWLAVEAIRSGEAEICYPFDGRFARVPRVPWFKKLEKLLDIGVVINTVFKGKSGGKMPVSSVGGCLFYNKQAFIAAGMENENFISYGPEDCERWDRFHILGLSVKRITGCLYHLDHYIGPNSSKKHKHFAANEAELHKIRSMDKENLLKYISTWPWVKK